MPNRKCDKCPADAQPGRTKCAAHLAAARAYQAAKKARGECCSCKKPAAPGRVKCERHLGKQSGYTAGWKVHGSLEKRTPAAPVVVAANGKRRAAAVGKR